MSAGAVVAAVCLAAYVVAAYLMVRDLRDTAAREQRLAQLRREAAAEEPVVGRVADFQLLGWVPEEPRTKGNQ